MQKKNASSLPLAGLTIVSDSVVNNNIGIVAIMCNRMCYRAMLSVFVVLLANFACYAKDIYIAQNAKNRDTGVDANNTHSIAWLNTASNWGAGTDKISSGNTVHLTGTISNAIIIQGSGSPGSPITILFEPGAKMSAPTWTGAIISGMNHGYIIVDGGIDGIVEATDNGTGLTYQNAITGVSLTPQFSTDRIQGVEIKNITIRNLYVRTQNSADSSGGAGIIINANDSSVHNNIISWASIGVQWNYDGGQNASIFSNVINNISTGIVFGSKNSNATYAGINICNNDISDGYPWDNPSNLFHHDGIHYWGNGPDVTGLKIHGNYIHGNWGVNFTAQIFLEGLASNYEIYNNVLTSPIRHIYTKLAGPGFVYNNTFVNAGAAMDSLTGSVVDFANNILDNTDGLFFNGNKGSNPYFTSRNNLITNSGFVNAGANNFHLQHNSPAINAGLNFSNHFTDDKDGIPRPSNSAWDIGAYEHATISAPTNLRVTY